MRFRTTLIAALLLLLFGVYVYVFEYRWPQEKESREEQAKKMLSLDGKTVRALTVTNSHGSFSLEKAGGAPPEGPAPGAERKDWRILSPLDTDADDSVVNAMVNALEDLKSEQVVAEGAQDLAPFGLEKAKIRIEVAAEGEDGPLPALLVGKKSPVGQNSYGMKEGEKDVHLLNEYLDDRFDKGLDDLREKRIFRVNREDIERLEIRKAGTPRLELVRDQGRWEMVRPVRAPVAGSEADRLLDRFTSVSARSFDSEEDRDLRKFGLDAPERELVVTLAPDHTQARLELGKVYRTPGGEERVYAKRAETAGVVSLDGDLVDAFDTDPESLRERKVFPFQPWTVEEIRLNVGGQEITAVKKGAGKWRITEPFDARAASSVVTPFLSDLSRLEGTAFHDKPSDALGLKQYGLDPPLARVTLLEERLSQDGDEGGGGEKTAPIGTLLLGAPDGPGGRTYACTEDGITVAEVDPAFFQEKFPASAEALRDRRILDFFPYQAASIDLQGPGQEVALERRNGDWRIRRPESRAADAQQVNDLLAFLSDLKSERIRGAPVSEVPEKGRDLFGLQSPEYRVTVQGEDGEDLGTVLISASGPQAEPDLRYVRNEEDDWIGVIGRGTVEELSSRFADLPGNGG